MDQGAPPPNAVDDAARITRERSSLQQFRTASTASGLLPAEERLLVKAVSGQDCVVGSGARPEAPDESLLVRASFLRFLALGGDNDVRVDMRGIVLIGAVIEGSLQLAGANGKLALQLQNCFFTGAIMLPYARIPLLRLSGSRVSGINGDLLQVDGSVLLDEGFLSTAPVRFYGSRIEGDLDCRGASFQIDEPAAGTAEPPAVLTCWNARIRGDVILCRTSEHDFHAQGQVRLANAKIGGRLVADGAHLDFKGKTALAASGAVIDGLVSLRNVRITGQLDFRQATIGGSLVLETAPRNDPVAFAQVDMTGPEVWRSTGANPAQGAIIVSLRALRPAPPGATEDPGFLGLLASGLTVKASVTLKGVLTGPVSLDLVRINGDLDCRACLIDGGQSNALSCGNADITGTVYLQPRTDAPKDGRYVASDLFEARGGVNLSGTRIGGDLVCAGGWFAAGPKTLALDCSNARIGRDADLSAARLVMPAGGDPPPPPDPSGAALSSLPSEFSGEVSFYAAHIGGNLLCSGSSLHAPGTSALNGRSAEIGGSVFLGRAIDQLPGSSRSLVIHEAFRSAGEVSLAFATVGSNLECQGGRFENADGNALDVSTAQIKGSVNFGCFFLPAEGLAFRFASRGLVSLWGTNITGGIDCSGGWFVNPGQAAISAPGVQIGGIANFQQMVQGGGFGPRCQTSGSIDLTAAHIGGYMQCIGGRFENPGGYTLGCSGIKVDGAVFLSRDAVPDEATDLATPVLSWTVPDDRPAPFQSDGTVDFKYAQIASPMLCQGGHFRNRRADKAAPTQAELALDVRGARVGSLEFGMALPGTLPAIMEGSCNLAGAHAIQLIDTGFAGSAAFFPRTVESEEEPGKRLDCVMTLDNFTYDRLGWESPVAAPIRKAWLSRQPAEHLSEKTFRPQPFDQLARVLRAMGQDDQATTIAIYKQQLTTDLLPRREREIAVALVLAMSGAVLIARDLIGTAVFSEATAAQISWGIVLVCLAGLYFRGGLTWLGRTSLGALTLYGYKPSRILVIALLVGVGVGQVLRQAAEQGVVVPQAGKEEKLPPNCGPDWTACASRPFNPIVYSFDTMLPLKLGQADKWSVELKPVQLWFMTLPPSALQWLLWLEIIFGWVVSGIVLALVSGMLKKE